MLIDEPVEPRRWQRFAEPAVVLWISACSCAVWWGRLDLGVGPRPGMEPQSVAGDIGASLVALVLIGASGAVVAEILSRLVRQVWLGRVVPWPLSRCLRQLRRYRWCAAARGVTASEDSAIQQRHARRRVRIALSEPRSPTWIGDRVMALESRVREVYGLDLPSAWPRLWLVLPGPVRAELRSAARLWYGSARWAAWAVLYAVPALLWWPLAILAAVTLIAAVQTGRRATASLTDLMEAAVDLHGAALAAALGCVDGDGPALSPPISAKVNRLNRKGV
jgi:hypothetical protein